MIGWINLSVESFIRDNFGDDTWVQLVAKVRATRSRRPGMPLGPMCPAAHRQSGTTQRS